MSAHPVNARPIRSSRERPTGRWLSLGPASRLVGVDPDTLRRWADGGRVEVYVTPGRHRRFDRRALERLASGGGRREAPAAASLGASRERLTRAYQRSYAGRDQARRAAVGNAGDRDRYRQAGRQLVEALIAHLEADRADDAARDQAEATAMALVDTFATHLQASGMNLTGVVALFIAARRPFMKELAAIGRRRTLDAARLAELYEDASGLLDRLLLRLVDTYQAAAG
ncbi:MAG: MerR family transcriptional regulator [Candidatus Limnocylindrales bacterium]